MTSTLLLWIAIGGLAVAGISATGTKVLHNFSRADLDEYCRRRKRRERFAEVLDHHEQVALGVESLQIVGTAVLLIAGGFWMTAAGRDSVALHWTELLAAIGAGSALMLAATIWIPWAVMNLWSSPFLYHTWRVWLIVSWLLRPLQIGVSVAHAVLRRLAGRHEETHEDEEEAFEDEIRTIVTEGEHDGLLEADAREMIEGVMELGDADVSDIMTPRSEVDAIAVEMNWRDVLDFVIQAGRTRIPVYQGTLDIVVGVLYVKDLLPELAKSPGQPRRTLRQIMRKPRFVPKTKPVDDLLQDFLKTRNHLMIVLDEYQSVVGVVTIEDVLEEIVGEIVDEWDEEAEDEIVQIDDSSAEVLGRMHLDELNERLALDLPEPDDYDTIAGFVVQQLGHIPKPGESLVFDNVRITVLEASRRRVERVRIEMLEQHSLEQQMRAGRE